MTDVVGCDTTATTTSEGYTPAAFFTQSWETWYDIDEWTSTPEMWSAGMTMSVLFTRSRLSLL